MRSSPPTIDPVLTRTFAVAPHERCRLRVPRAAVELAPGADGEATVTLTAADDTNAATARALADTLSVRHAGGVLRVEPAHRTRMSAHDWRALRNDHPLPRILVRVPASFGADVHAAGGSIDARGLHGPVTLEAPGGSMRAVRLGGRLDLHVHRSRATVEDFDGKTLSAQVYSSPLTVRGATASTVKVESAAGPLRLEGIQAALSVRTRGGAARIARLHGPLDAEVCGGALSFFPETGHAARVRAPGGDVHLHFGEALAAHLHLSAPRLTLPPLPHFEGERSQQHAEGVLNGSNAGTGGAMLKGDGTLIDATAPGGTIRCE